MQPRTRVITLALIAVAAMFALAGCGGGKTGKTWFNLPSVEVEVNEAGQAKVAGFTLPAPIFAGGPGRSIAGGRRAAN